MNAEVMVLRRDVELPLGLDDLQRQPIDQQALRKLFDFLEFHSLADRLEPALGEGLAGLGRETTDLEVTVERPDGAKAVGASLKQLAAADGLLCVHAEWTSQGELEGIAVVLDGEPPTSRVAWIAAADLERPALAEALEALVSDRGRPLALHDGKPFVKWLLAHGVEAPRLGLDTMLAAYLLDPAEDRYLLEDLLARYTPYAIATGDGPAEGQLALDVDSVDPVEVAALRAAAVAALAGPTSEALAAQGLAALYEDVEIPLVRVLAKMEHVGVGVDVDELRALNQRLSTEADQLMQQIWADAGEQFNVNSTPQLRTVLYDNLGLVPGKKTKTGFSTDAATLEKLRGQHPIIEHLLRYREVEKLRNTYGDGLLAEVADDGRIHATFNQAVARTGRLSSDRPNLHNIPVRTEEGRSFRRAFIPCEGFELLVADYNQIELRCIAHLADDPGLLAAFAAATDIHTETAARIFSVEPGDVTTEQRSKAKMVSYGLAYGMEAYGLGQRLGIATAEAQEILDAYFDAFPRVRSYMETTVAEARARGYTETLFGRRRQIPELSSSNFRIRQAGERQAMNAGIQGLAADIFKVALVRLDQALVEAEAQSRIILQVHDEVLLEVPPTEHRLATDLTLDAMRGAFELRVPLEVNLAFGTSWAEAK
jgi:DNA polymerase-1